MLDVRDINNVGFKSRRATDPLDPIYKVNGMTIADDSKYTKPRPLPKGAEHDFFPLKTNDIEGAWPGWTPPHECQPPVERRRHFRNTNFVGDIAGAQPDTVKHAIRTNRVVNPLNPVYDSLDGERLKPPMTPNLLNGDPKEFGLAQPDELPGYNRRPTSMPSQSVVKVGSGAQTGSSPGVVPPMDLTVLSPALPDTDVEKDQMIAQLEEELASLRGSKGGTISLPPRHPGERKEKLLTVNLPGGGTGLEERRSGRDSGRGNGSANAIQANWNSGRRGSRGAQPATPAEKRESARLAEDIAAVRDL